MPPLIDPTGRRLPELTDPHGVPLKKLAQELQDEIAGPVLGSVRSPFAQHPAEGITPARLAEIHRAAALGYSQPYQELAEDIEERDLHYAAVLGTRKRSVEQLPLNIIPASDDPEHQKHADFLTDWLKAGVVDDVLFGMLDAIGKGYSVHEIMWRVGPDGILPERLVYRPQRWFEISRLDGETVELRVDDGFQPLNPHKFLVHRSHAKSGLLLRSGLARIASWAWMYKAFTSRDWAVFVQNYGLPIRVGKFGPSSSESDRRTLWRAVSNIAGDCAAIIPDSMTIEFIDQKGSTEGSKLFLERANWLDQQISKLVLGQTATTDAIGGGHAVSREHRLVQEDIERADAKALATTLKRQLFNTIIAFNFGEQDAYPDCHIGQSDDVPLKDLVGALQFLGPQGLRVRASEMRERLGLEEPDGDDEEVVGGRPAAPQGPTPTVASPALPTQAENPPKDYAQPAPGEAPGEAKKPALHMLLSRHMTAVAPELVDALTDSLARDAQAALEGLTGQVRGAIEAAHDMHDMVERLSRLQLDQAEFTLAMQRGVALAQLVGQASLLDELHARG